MNKVEKNICYQCVPQLGFSEWNENNKFIDSDIQTDYHKIVLNKTYNEIVEFDINGLTNEEKQDIFNKAKDNEIKLNNKSVIISAKNDKKFRNYFEIKN
jgi:hypothetical protein